MTLNEMPMWAIWTIMVTVAFVVGIGVGVLLQIPEMWRPK